MQLTYDKGYEDYSDSANWLPRLQKLKAASEAITLDTAASMTEQQLLDAMEHLEELMRFYCVEKDHKNLEPVMRKFQGLLKLCREQGISGFGISYLEMVFLRMNAMLYRGSGQIRQSAQGYEKCLPIAQKCFGQLKFERSLTTDQLVYVGWNCVECFKEAAEVQDSLLNAEGSAQILRSTIPMLEWLQDPILTAPGICDQAAELYASIGGVVFQRQDYATAGKCYNRAIDLFNGLDERIGSDFYRARAIWIRCTHGIMEFMGLGDAQVMLTCEREVWDYLRSRSDARPRDTAIVRSAGAMVTVQKAAAFQQSGDLRQAVSLAEVGCRDLGQALEVLEQDYKPRRDYYRTVVYRIAARIFNSYVGALDTLGVMYHYNEQPDEAKEVFTKALSLLTDSDDYSMGESGAATIRAEIDEYMALIYSDAGDAFQTEFYGTQSADAAVELAKQTGNPALWGIAVVSCTLVAEVCLGMKNKPKALTYAEMGLQACDQLVSSQPQHPSLTLRDSLVKFRKKASRRFF